MTTSIFQIHCFDAVVAPCQAKKIRVLGLRHIGSYVRGTASDGPLDVDLMLDCSDTIEKVNWNDVLNSVQNHLAYHYPSFTNRIIEQENDEIGRRYKAKFCDLNEEYLMDLHIALGKPSGAFRSVAIHEALERQYRLMGLLAERNKATVKVLKSILRSSERKFLVSANVEFFEILLALMSGGSWAHVTIDEATDKLRQIAAAGSLENLKETGIYDEFNVPCGFTSVGAANFDLPYPASLAL